MQHKWSAYATAGIIKLILTHVSCVPVQGNASEKADAQLRLEQAARSRRRRLRGWLAIVGTVCAAGGVFAYRVMQLHR